ncbi:hypothetical protein EV360DRAFT_26278, partial [Lentinula raphanica]
SQENTEMPRPEQGGERISVEYLFSLSNRHCVWAFRFTASEIIELADILDLPELIRTRSRYTYTSVEALGLLLLRFRHGTDEFELSTRYNRSQSAISEILTWMVRFLDERWKHLLDCDQEGILHPDKLVTYANAITGLGSPLKNCIAFLDCTIRRVCRPGWGQNVAYNGYKKFHALKYQALML